MQYVKWSLKRCLEGFLGLGFHEITHICNIFFLNPASLANQEMSCGSGYNGFLMSLRVSLTIMTDSLGTQIVFTQWSLVRISPYTHHGWWEIYPRNPLVWGSGDLWDHPKIFRSSVYQMNHIWWAAFRLRK